MSPARLLALGHVACLALVGAWSPALAQDCAPLACEELLVVPERPCASAVVLTAVTSGGEGHVDVTWDFDGDGLADAAGSPVLAQLPPGVTDVSFRAGDSCRPDAQSCALTRPVTVEPEGAPILTLSGPPDFCAANGDDVVLDVGPGWTGHAWRRDWTVIPGESAQTLRVTESGIYQARVQDGRGCAWESAPVYVSALACQCGVDCPRIDIQPEVACEGEPRWFTAVHERGLVLIGVSWDWNLDGRADTWTNPALITLPPGTTRVRAVVGDNGCPPWPNGRPFETDVVSLPLTPPALSAIGLLDFCADEGGSVLLRADAGHDAYQWSRNGVDLPGETSETLLVTESGRHAVRTRRGNSCWASSPALDLNAAACAPCGPPPGEVSSVAEGDAPLRVTQGGERVAFAAEPDAAAYSVHSGALGEWHVTQAATAGGCHRTDAVALPNGTLELAVQLAPRTWVLVSASTDCHEGPVGAGSDGRPRESAPTWQPCGRVR